MEQNTKDQTWERKVLAEIAQMRGFLGVSRSRCSLSDDQVARIFATTLLLTYVLAYAITGSGTAAAWAGPVISVALMWLVGLIFTK